MQGLVCMDRAASSLAMAPAEVLQGAAAAPLGSMCNLPPHPYLWAGFVSPVAGYLTTALQAS